MVHGHTLDQVQSVVSGTRTDPRCHLVTLELSGDERPPKPLRRATKTDAASTYNPEDLVEAYLHAQVCHYLHLASHHPCTTTSYLPLARAQQLIDANWTTAWALAPRYLSRHNAARQATSRCTRT